MCLLRKNMDNFFISHLCLFSRSQKQFLLLKIIFKVKVAQFFKTYFKVIAIPYAPKVSISIYLNFISINCLA